MKLRNKKTGEIKEFGTVSFQVGHMGKYKTLAELNEEWEDYEAPKEYWYITYNACVVSASVNVNWEREKEIGNCFETKEEAEKAVEKLKAWKRLKDKGFKITLRSCKGTAWLEANWGNLQGDYSDITLLFGGGDE